MSGEPSVPLEGKYAVGGDTTQVDKLLENEHVDDKLALATTGVGRTESQKQTVLSDNETTGNKYIGSGEQSMTLEDSRESNSGITGDIQRKSPECEDTDKSLPTSDDNCAADYRRRQSPGDGLGKREESHTAEHTESGNSSDITVSPTGLTLVNFYVFAVFIAFYTELQFAENCFARHVFCCCTLAYF